MAMTLVVFICCCRYARANGVKEGWPLRLYRLRGARAIRDAAVSKRAAKEQAAASARSGSRLERVKYVGNTIVERLACGVLAHGRTLLRLSDAGGEPLRSK